MKIDGPALVALITVAGTVAVGAIAGFVNWLVRRQSKAMDLATARKTNAETVAREVQTARELLTEVRTYFQERLAEQDEDHKSEIHVLTGQVRQLQIRMVEFEAQSKMTRVSFASHQAWDISAWEILRRTHPDYPPPPVVEGL